MGEEVWRADQQGGRSVLNVLARYERGARTCLEPAGRTGVNADLVRMPLEWRLFIRGYYASMMSWQQLVISSCLSLDALNILERSCQLADCTASSPSAVISIVADLPP